MPGAIWRPITVNKSRWRLVPLRVNLHVAVSEAASLHGYFNAPGRVDSHFYVRRDGTIEQYVDTSVVAYADLEGNGSSISVETQGGVKNANGEPWTAAQVEALARIYAWAVARTGSPARSPRIPGPAARRMGCRGTGSAVTATSLARRCTAASLGGAATRASSGRSAPVPRRSGRSLPSTSGPWRSSAPRRRCPTSSLFLRPSRL